jgi:hypothetical protein
MNIQHLFKLSIIASSLSLTACGGSDSEPTPPPPPANVAPTVSFSPDTSTVIEKSAVGVAVVATDTDGSIASYQWKVVSNHTLTLAGATSSNVTFTAPDVGLSGDTVKLEVTVTDDDGAKTTADTSILINAKTIPFAIKGLATDSPLSNSKISVKVGGRDITVDTTADADGKYSVDLLLDDSEASSFISIIAKGVGQQSNAGLISLLGTAEELSILAGDDKILTAGESFAVNVTNITTAKYALAKLANGGVAITNSSLLESLYSGLNYDEVMILATAIKVAIDKSAGNNALVLPDGVTDTLSLVEDTAKSNEYVQMVKFSPEFTEAQQEIYQDANLIDVASAFVVPPTYYVLPLHTLSGGYPINFDADGTGNIEDALFDWVELNGEITLTVGSQKIQRTFTVPNGHDSQVEAVKSVDKYQIKRLSSGVKSDVLLFTKTNRLHFLTGGFTDEVTTQSYTQNAAKEAAILPIEEIAAGFGYVPVSEEGEKDGSVDASYQADVLILNTEGQGTSRLESDSFTWKMEQGALQLDYGDGQLVRFKKVGRLGVMDIISSEYSDDGETFFADAVGMGKVIASKLSWVTAQVPGIYRYETGTFDDPLAHFWLELHANGDAETYFSGDRNGDGQLTSDEVGAQYGKWKIEDSGALNITRTRGINGKPRHSNECRDAATPDCALYNERKWTLVAQENNEYGLSHEMHFYYPNGVDVSYDHRTIFKIDARPVAITELPATAPAKTSNKAWSLTSRFHELESEK